MRGNYKETWSLPHLCFQPFQDLGGVYPLLTPSSSAKSLGLVTPSANRIFAWAILEASMGVHTHASCPPSSSRRTSIGATSSPFTDRHLVKVNSK